MALATLFVQQLDADNWAIQINGLKNERNKIFIDQGFDREKGAVTPEMTPPLFQRLRSIFSPTIRSVVPPMEKITEYIHIFYSLGYYIVGASSNGSHPASQTFLWTFHYNPATVVTEDGKGGVNNPRGLRVAGTVARVASSIH